jgi:hypothetical protein
MSSNNPHVERSVITTTVYRNGTQSVESVVVPSSTPATTAKIDEIIELATSICGEIPVLLWIDNMLGMTGYIDNVKYDNLSDVVMQGTDSDGRKFLALRYVPETETRYQPKCLVLHQRYPGSDIIVFAGGRGSPTVWDEQDVGVVQWVTALLDGNVVPRYNNPFKADTFKLA